MQELPQRQKILWPDETYYFLTMSTFLHFPYFKEDEQKQIVLNQIKQLKKSLNIPILAYSISINHFHLKFYLKVGSLMTQIKNILHSGISREYRKNFNVPYKEFWQSTKVLRIKDEDMSWKVTGYIIGNLLKHKEVSTFDELKGNPFSSYKYTAEKFGDEMTKELVYRVIDVSEDAEGMVDIAEFKDVRAEPPPWAA